MRGLRNVSPKARQRAPLLQARVRCNQMLRRHKPKGRLLSTGRSAEPFSRLTKRDQQMPRSKFLQERGDQVVTKITFNKKAGGVIKFHLSNGGLYVVSNKRLREVIDFVVDQTVSICRASAESPAEQRKPVSERGLDAARLLPR
jgi:hypothetical protein